jgi:hypothetical protein
MFVTSIAYSTAMTMMLGTWLCRGGCGSFRCKIVKGTRKQPHETPSGVFAREIRVASRMPKEERNDSQQDSGGIGCGLCFCGQGRKQYRQGGQGRPMLLFACPRFLHVPSIAGYWIMAIIEIGIAIAIEIDRTNPKIRPRYRYRPRPRFTHPHTHEPTYSHTRFLDAVSLSPSLWTSR